MRRDHADSFLKSAEYKWQTDNKRSEYSEYARKKVAETCVGITKLEVAKCRYESLDAQREYNYNQSDLVAQRKSALWAYIMGAAAVIGMALSAFGVWLIKATFDATREANTIQKTAIINAGWDAKEARNALIEAERAIMTILSVQQGVPEPTSEFISLHLAMANKGRTNARGFEVAFCISNTPVYKKRRTYVRKFNEMSLPGHGFDLSNIQVKRKSLANKYVIGSVSYRTIHGAKFETYFCYHVSGDIRRDSLGGFINQHLMQSRCARLPGNT